MHHLLLVGRLLLSNGLLLLSKLLFGRPLSNISPVEGILELVVLRLQLLSPLDLLFHKNRSLLQLPFVIGDLRACLHGLGHQYSVGSISLLRILFGLLPRDSAAKFVDVRTMVRTGNWVLKAVDLRGARWQ